MDMTRTQQRLLVNVSRNSESGCWEWTGQISNSGYGRLKVRDRYGDLCMQSAQLASYEAFIGALPDGSQVTQLCKNRLCVNPEHLALSG